MFLFVTCASVFLPKTFSQFGTRVMTRLVDRLHPDYARLRESCPHITQLAFNIAAIAHHGQRRTDGSVYLSHPVEVTRILYDLNPQIQSNMLTVALLHDTLEGTQVTLPFLKVVFGEDVSDLVVRCSKASQLARCDLKTRKSRLNDELILIENMRIDWRVAVIEVCDRLHNMRTISQLTYEKRTRIASQTYDLYMPVAHRLGLFRIKTELGDLAFRELEPSLFEELYDFVSKNSATHWHAMKQTQHQLVALLKEEGIDGSVHSRLKSLHSISEKMRKNAFSTPEEVYDINALRLVVNNNEPCLCYLLLAKIHELWSPVPGALKDYIANPKPNGYSSLHTVVRHEDSILEIQIRTGEMHEVAEHGAAAHWSYKTPSYLLPLLEELDTDIVVSKASQTHIDARVMIKGRFPLCRST